MEEDVYGNVSFDGMKKVTIMFDERPSFGYILARACEEISFNLNDPAYRLRAYCPMLHLGQYSEG